MNWLGSSTASHSTPLTPPMLGQRTSVSRWCRPWPNSWNRVSTSSCVSRDGLPSAGKGKLQVRNATGTRGRASSSNGVRQTSIQAPPRLPLRAK